MAEALKIGPDGALEFLSLGALVHRLDPGVIPYRLAAVSTDAPLHAAAYGRCLGKRPDLIYGGPLEGDVRNGIGVRVRRVRRPIWDKWYHRDSLKAAERAIYRAGHGEGANLCLSGSPSAPAVACNRRHAVAE